MTYNDPPPTPPHRELCLPPTYRELCLQLSFYAESPHAVLYESPSCLAILTRSYSGQGYNYSAETGQLQRRCSMVGCSEGAAAWADETNHYVKASSSSCLAD
jgi:hypothetical protein